MKKISLLVVFLTLGLLVASPALADFSACAYSTDSTGLSYEGNTNCTTGPTTSCDLPYEGDTDPADITTALASVTGELNSYQNYLNGALADAQNSLNQETQTIQQEEAPLIKDGGDTSRWQALLNEDNSENTVLVGYAHADYDSGISQAQSCITFLTNYQANTACQSQSQYGQNSSAVGSQCECNSGYQHDPYLNGGECDDTATIATAAANATASCHAELGENSYSTGGTSCACDNFYQQTGQGASLVCTPIPNDVRYISPNAAAWVENNSPPSDSGNNFDSWCASDSALSSIEVNQCIAYEMNPKGYLWLISTPPASSSVATQTPPATTSSPVSAPVSVAPVSQSVKHSVASVAVKSALTFAIPTTTAVSSAPPITDDNVQPSVSIWQTVGDWLSKLNPFSWFAH